MTGIQFAWSIAAIGWAMYVFEAYERWHLVQIVRSAMLS
jgi:hypothetical protein